ncbi:MAG: hypothetical protein JWL77_4520 [Chthonomonadaceae bacterium]|nr:hypothetical protein [Chthonomonadaceae bacterium]
MVQTVEALFDGTVLRPDTPLPLEADPNVEIVPLADDLFARAFQLYRSRPDKEWGLIDCVSFMVKWLVEHGADISAKDADGRTALDYAVI